MTKQIFTPGMRFSRRGFPALVALLCAAVCCSDTLAVDIEVLRLTGKTEVHQNVLSASESAVTFADGKRLKTDDLRRLTFKSDSDGLSSNQPVAGKPVPSIRIELVGQGRLQAKAVHLGDEELEVERADGRSFRLSLGAVTAIRMTGENDREWQGVLKRRSKDNDVLLVKSGNSTMTIPAVLESLGPDGIEFDWNKATRKLPLDQVIGVVLIDEGEMTTPAPYLVETREGDRLPCLEMVAIEADEVLKCQLGGGGSLELNVNSIGRIEIQSERLKAVSDLEPVTVRSQPVVGFPRGWRKDLNVRGEPLKAGGQVYSRGIGMQAGTALVYELDAQAELLTGICSVDPPGQAGGECEFVVMADGQEKLRIPVTRKDTGVPLQVDVQGVRRLELRVDYGAGLDLGDHANWCDLSLVLKSKS